jgi:hypothetical protein
MALRLLSVLTLLPTAFATLGTGKDRNGVTQIFGNSFGEPGVNATYDYIVCSIRKYKVSLLVLILTNARLSEAVPLAIPSLLVSPSILPGTL